MIITLKKADFSANKIETLNKWLIFTSMGTGASYVGDRLVDKGAALNATVNIADGYAIGDAGVKVTMGGTEQSGAAAVSGNTVTITLASVTGPVNISVPTINTSTGEEDEGGENGEITYYKDTSGTLVEGKALDASSYTLKDKTGYFVYTNVPVIEGATYKSTGSARVWFLNSAGTGLSTLNIFKSEGGNQYEFTIPSGCTQISIDFDTTGVTSPSHTPDSAYLEKL